MSETKRKNISGEFKAKLKAATTEHMQTLEKSPERVKKYFQDSRVKYAA